MPSIKDQAIVLRRLDYSESSQVLALLTREHGAQRLIAKGVKRSTKKKFAAGIDLLERGALVFLPAARSEAGLGTLTEWRQLDLYLGLRGRLDRWYAAQYAAEITAGMSEEADPQPDVYDALVRFLSEVSAGADPLPRLVEYQRTLLSAAGLFPDLGRCVLCDRPAPPGRAALYAPNHGGLVCRQCAPAAGLVVKLVAATLEDLRARTVRPENASAAFHMLDTAIAHALGRPTTLARAVLEIIPSASRTSSRR